MVDHCRESLQVFAPNLISGCPALNVTTLKLIAKDCGIPGYSRLKKADLCQALIKRLGEEPELVIPAVESVGVEVLPPTKRVLRPAVVETEEDKALKEEYCRCVFEHQIRGRKDSPSLCENRYRQAGKTKPASVKCRYKKSYLDSFPDEDIKGYADFRKIITKRLQRPEVQKQVEAYLAKRSQLI